MNKGALNITSLTVLCTILHHGFLSAFHKFGEHHSITFILGTEEKYEGKGMNRTAKVGAPGWLSR